VVARYIYAPKEFFSFEVASAFDVVDS